jgi:hypothetical protein
VAASAVVTYYQTHPIMTQMEVAKALGISQIPVSRALRAAGLGVGRGGRQKHFDHDAILKLVLQDISHGDIANQVGCCRRLVSNIARKAGYCVIGTPLHKQRVSEGLRKMYARRNGEHNGKDENLQAG